MLLFLTTWTTATGIGLPSSSSGPWMTCGVLPSNRSMMNLIAVVSPSRMALAQSRSTRARLRVTFSPDGRVTSLMPASSPRMSVMLSPFLGRPRGLPLFPFGNGRPAGGTGFCFGILFVHQLGAELLPFEWLAVPLYVRGEVVPEHPEAPPLDDAVGPVGVELGPAEDAAGALGADQGRA